MKLAPFGIFCLVTARFGEAQARGNLGAVLQQTGAYFGTVLAGLGVHAFLTLPLILWIFTRRNPFRFMYQMSQALLTAFSTASSTATLPITMNCAVEKAKVSKQSSDFVLPLGATINMDGTALYEAAAAIFIAQAIGFELTITSQLVIAVHCYHGGYRSRGYSRSRAGHDGDRVERSRITCRIYRADPVGRLATRSFQDGGERLWRFAWCRSGREELRTAGGSLGRSIGGEARLKCLLRVLSKLLQGTVRVKSQA